MDGFGNDFFGAAVGVDVGLPERNELAMGAGWFLERMEKSLPCPRC